MISDWLRMKRVIAWILKHKKTFILRIRQQSFNYILNPFPTRKGEGRDSAAISPLPPSVGLFLIAFVIIYRWIENYLEITNIELIMPKN